MEAWTAVVIDDDDAIRELMEMILSQSGFTVICAADGPSGLRAIEEHQPLLTTCDVTMPGIDGFTVAKQIRRVSDTYLMMISALSTEADIVQGLAAGADDYMSKPFSPRELRARVDAMVRRLETDRRHSAAPVTDAPATPTSWVSDAVAQLKESSSVLPAAPSRTAAPEPAQSVPAPATITPPPPPVRADGVLHHNGLVLHTATGTVRVDERPVDLTTPELELLTALMTTGRRVRSKADLVLAMRGQGHVTAYFVNESDKRKVDSHIESTRRKLGDDGASPRFIETVKGVGYRLTPPY